MTPEAERTPDANGGTGQPQFEMSQIDPALYQSQQINTQDQGNYIDASLPPTSTQAPQTGTAQSATPNVATPQEGSALTDYEPRVVWGGSDQPEEGQTIEPEQPAGEQVQERRRSGRTVKPPKRELETISPVKKRVRQRVTKSKEGQKQDAAVGDGTVERHMEPEQTLQMASDIKQVTGAGPSFEAPKRKQAMRNSGRVDRRTGAYVQYPNPKASKIADSEQEQGVQQQQMTIQPPQQPMQSVQTGPVPAYGISFQQSPFGEGAFPNMGLPHGHVAMQAQSTQTSPPQPLQHVEPPVPADIVPVDPSIPDPDHGLVPFESCLTLRKWGINPNFMLIPPRGHPCPFAEKKSQCKGRMDWNRSSWERHVFGHLPDKLKPYWQCPVCMRTFARKDSFKRHFGLKKDGGDDGAGGLGDGGKCWSEGNLAGIPESEWASKWLFEPVVVRFPETAPKVRRADPPGADTFSAGPGLEDHQLTLIHHDMVHIPPGMVPVPHEAMQHLSQETLARIAQAAMAQFQFTQQMA